MVWVNQAINNSALTANGVNLIALLGQAGDFMVFDTTIMAVYLHLDFSLVTSADRLVRKVGVALAVHPDTLDAADITEGPLQSSIGPPWMWHSTTGIQIAAVGELTLPLPAFESNAHVKAKRRFRENNSTLFLEVENIVHANDTLPILNGFVRTLIRIP